MSADGRLQGQSGQDMSRETDKRMYYSPAARAALKRMHFKLPGTH